MDGLTFESAARPIPVDAARADVALFVGFVHRRATPARRPGETDDAYLRRCLPAALVAWLADTGWWAGTRATVAPVTQLVALEDVPVPLDHWDAFDALFAWDQRPLDDQGRLAHATLGNAVRRFFAEGGRKAYVVRLGDAWPAATSAELRRREPLAALTRGFAATPADRSTWSGFGHVLGLEEVAFLAIPDLPDLFGHDPLSPRREFTPRAPEAFVECGDHPVPALPLGLRGFPEPRCDAAGFSDWSAWVRRLGDWLARYAREVQGVMAVPLPVKHSAHDLRAARQAETTAVASLSQAAVQLVQPWVRTRESAALPGDLEPPDALLVGVLARNAFERGTWRPVFRATAPRVQALEPVPDRSTLEQLLPVTAAGRRRRDHITTLGPSPTGFRWLSDVTTAPDETARPANVVRLVRMLRRAARRTGETLVFARNGEALWARLVEALSRLLSALWNEGALAGTTAAEAFEVRCDRSTMTQADLDAGRVIVRVSFTTATPIQHLTVVLALEDGALVSLLPVEAGRPIPDLA